MFIFGWPVLVWLNSNIPRFCHVFTIGSDVSRSVSEVLGARDHRN